MLKPQIAERPFQCWGIDIVTMSKEAEYKYLITCVDYFTRWIEVGKLRTKKAPATCEWFTPEIIHRYGRPEVIISDRGGEFDSDFRKRLHQQGITHRRSRARHQKNPIVFIAWIDPIVHRLSFTGPARGIRRPFSRIARDCGGSDALREGSRNSTSSSCRKRCPIVSTRIGCLSRWRQSSIRSVTE